MEAVARTTSDPAELSRRFEAAWNSHDMTAFAELFEPDATFVTRFGHYWRGRDEIVSCHAEIHSTIYKDCSISNCVQDVDFIRDDIAIVHLRSVVSVGRATATVPQQFAVEFAYIATRSANGWRIRAAQNVAIANAETGESRVERQSGQRLPDRNLHPQPALRMREMLR
jgi:uncharacterized protein (TIGR02246 family)